MIAALQIVNVSSGYGSSMVVHNTNLAIAPGEIVALVGKNGMGKSSLLKTILGFLPARSGSIKLSGRRRWRLICGAVWPWPTLRRSRPCSRICRFATTFGSV